MHKHHECACGIAAKRTRIADFHKSNPMMPSIHTTLPSFFQQCSTPSNISEQNLFRKDNTCFHQPCWKRMAAPDLKSMAAELALLLAAAPSSSSNPPTDSRQQFWHWLPRRYLQINDVLAVPLLAWGLACNFAIQMLTNFTFNLASRRGL